MSFLAPENMDSCATNTRLLDLIRIKKTALCLSLDIDTWLEGRALLLECAPYICMVKLHCDLITDWHSEIGHDLRNLAAVYGFLIMQDSKFSDVPKITYRQLTQPPFCISSWADFVTIQPLNYLDTYQFLTEHPNEKLPTLVCVAEMNTQNSFSKDPDYLAIVKRMVTHNQDVIPAIVSQSLFANDPVVAADITKCIRMTPGVCIDPEEETARYRTIENAIQRDKHHVVIIGESLLTKLKNKNVNLNKIAERSYLAFTMQW